MKRAVFVLVAATLLAPWFAPVLSAQDRGPEANALREAGSLETKGKLPEAEAILRKLLDTQATSVGALFALERVLRAEQKIAGMLPVTERFLATTPDASGVRLMRIKVLAELDSVDAVKRETEEWVKRAPTDPVLYREAFPLWQRSTDPEKTLDALRKARTASNDPLLLALEMGDLFVAAHADEDAANEWARAAGATGDRATEILKRVGQISDQSARTRMAGALMDALIRPPTTIKKQTVAIQVALAFGRADLGLNMAKALAPQLDPPQRRPFLENVSTWAVDDSAHNVVLWALTELRAALDPNADPHDINVRINKAALAAGDTAQAIEAGRLVSSKLPTGSAERRRLMADELRLRARRADESGLSDDLDAFRKEYPQAPELDELATLISRTLRDSGQAEGATNALTDVKGPESTFERAYLHLAAGEFEMARAMLILSVAGISPARGTEALQLTSLLTHMTPAGQKVVAACAVQVHRGQAREGALALEQAVPGLPEPDRPLALAQAARMAASAGIDEDAARMRAALLSTYPEAPDVPETALAQARWLGRTPKGVPEAVELLQNLILKSPDHSVAPEARRELQRLQGR